MIHYITGNLLDSKAEALVNTVNTVGVMGKGVALQFRQQFPENTRLYTKAVKEGSIAIGTLLVTKDVSLHGGEKIIINFPTKTDWRKPSEYSYIEEGLQDMVQIIGKKNIKSIALPPLGAGNGGLNWVEVKKLIDKYLTPLTGVDIYVYEPTRAIEEALKKERAKLTPARAMLLDVLYDLVKNGEFVSEFAAEKVAYFLQRFGAEKIFKLRFTPNFYGPYSGKVKHVLYYLNGSYITGYSSKDKKPFEELGIVANAEADIKTYLDIPDNDEYKAIAQKTKQFLTGFYSPFGLELLSTIDYILSENKVQTFEEIQRYLWSDRKKTLFNNRRFIEVAVSRINQFMN
ncbi:Appr-1-p processing protein [Terrimonas sp.]|uniref:type II toxin-antitoxin system antitoxin DNA ADP-ribosyl glycohydrolase DarG n=1 Tax=Terrimonas sp. TaxID=1914338 RepID=UPI000D50980D|nr:macro domain-containing protein [Terrimonas sp.]PVD51079.1 Appr-1-p processing protein [Terrimonas sp.]